jgi:hypothetical protein
LKRLAIPQDRATATSSISTDPATLSTKIPQWRWDRIFTLGISCNAETLLFCSIRYLSEPRSVFSALQIDHSQVYPEFRRCLKKVSRRIGPVSDDASLTLQYRRNAVGRHAYRLREGVRRHAERL